jgi:hypothetical protein
MGNRNALSYWWESQKERATRKTKTIIRWILQRWYGLGSSVSGLGPVEGSSEHSEPSGSTKCWEVL